MSAQPQPDGGRPRVDLAIASAFEGVVAAPSPDLVILVGGPGAEPARAIALILAESGRSSAVLQAADLAALTGGADRGLGARLLQEAIQYARRAKLPTIVDHLPIATSPQDTLETFKAAGFSTRIVLAVERDSAGALTRATRRLRTRALGASTVSAVNIADEWTPILNSLQSIPHGALDRITVLDGDGAAVHDGPPSKQTWTAVADARRLPLSGMQGVAWLSELRRLREYITSAPDSLSQDDLANIEQLYAIAQKQVLPQLPVRPESSAATVQRERLHAERQQLRQLIAEIGHEQAATRGIQGSGPDVAR